MNFARGGDGRGAPAEPRRGAHPVSRIRPRAARHAVRRDLSPVSRARMSRATSSNSPRSSTSIGPRARSSAPLRPPCGDRRADAADRLRESPGRANSARVSPPSNFAPRLSSTSMFSPTDVGGGIDVAALEAPISRAIDMPAEIVAAPRPPHFQHVFPSEWLLPPGYLPLSVVGSARRRRLRGLRGDRRPVRARPRRTAVRGRLFGGRTPRSGRRLSAVSRTAAGDRCVAGEARVGGGREKQKGAGGRTTKRSVGTGTKDLTWSLDSRSRRMTSSLCCLTLTILTSIYNGNTHYVISITHLLGEEQSIFR